MCLLSAAPSKKLVEPCIRRGDPTPSVEKKKTTGPRGWNALFSTPLRRSMTKHLKLWSISGKQKAEAAYGPSRQPGTKGRGRQKIQKSGHRMPKLSKITTPKGAGELKYEQSKDWIAPEREANLSGVSVEIGRRKHSGRRSEKGRLAR